jgi:hypothetical protein
MGRSLLWGFGSTDADRGGGEPLLSPCLAEVGQVIKRAQERCPGGSPAPVFQKAAWPKLAP